jgi:hypothetical protein
MRGHLRKGHQALYANKADGQQLVDVEECHDYWLVVVAALKT